MELLTRFVDKHVSFQTMYKEINFDRFVRGLLVVVGILAIYFILSYLSAVLIPFFVAWVFAYMLYPIVIFSKRNVTSRAAFSASSSLFFLWEALSQPSASSLCRLLWTR